MDPEIEDSTDAISKHKNGFELFVIQVASIFSLPIVTRLARVFDYSTEEIDKYSHAKDPGSDFIHSLKEKHIISFSDISRITEALKAIDLRGISDDVERLFKRNRENVKNEAQKKILIHALKNTYTEFFDKLQPSPFKDKLVHVNEVFFDCGVEVLHTEGLHESWERLESRHCILDDPQKASTRFLVLGEHGFGKSTLVQQLAYDWRNKCEQSPLREVEIFIFLKLSRVIHSLSIFASIKELLLSSEPDLSAENVHEIMNNAKSVVMVLHDFDKYVQKVNKSKKYDVIEIIKGQMFPKFRVILTTVPSCIPNGMPQSTIKVRLTGFDSDAQNIYFCKALGTTEELMKIKSEIEQNPMMVELCKIPFFFGIVLNLISEGNVPFSFKTVTKFFRYMIGSFHEQMKNKLRNEDRSKQEKINADHRRLDKLSFEALTEGNQEGKWIKQELRGLIGGALYDQYVAVGILVEEEVVMVNESPNAPTSTLVQRKTQTRFYHSIFREWFAAHYISAQRRVLNFENKLRKLYASGSKYVFQFACGLNPASTSSIIKYLQKCKDSGDLIQRCLLEQKENLQK